MEQKGTELSSYSRLPLMNSASQQRKYWFTRKQYGWGWVPSSWQGWAVLGVYTGGLISIFLRIDRNSHSASDTLINFFLPAIGMTILLVIISYLTGERPKWQWRKKNEA